MEFKDTPLKDILSTLNKHNDLLAKARHDYLSKEAERKHFEARLIQLIGPLGFKSHADRLIAAQAEPGWLEFHKALARLESIYEYQRLKFSILEREFQAQYLALKQDESIIKRGGE